MIAAIFNSDSTTANAYGLWQWDYGQVLRIQGLHLPSVVQVHFSLQETGGVAPMRAGVTKDGVTDVVIPDSMLENDGITSNYNIFAFIYLTDATSGQTEYKIKLQVKSRPKPEVPGGGEDPDIFHEAVQKVKESADKAAESERQAEGWAHGREDLPERVEDNAKYYAGKTAGDAAQTAEDRKEVKRLVESVAGIDEQVEKVEELTKQAQGAATNAALSEQAAETAETNAGLHQAGAEAAEINAELAEKNAKVSEQAVEQAKQLVTQMGQEVLNNKNHVDQTVQEFALTTQQALADVNNAGQTQTERVQGAGNTAVESVKTAQGTATQAVETAKSEAVQAVRTEGTAQTGNVTAEGAKQVQAVETAAQEIIADREQIKTNKADIADLRQNKAGAVVETVSGEMIQVGDSSGAAFEGMRIFGKSTQDGTPTPDAPVPIENVGSEGDIALTIEDDTNPQSITIPTPNGLPGIKVDSGGNYTDSTGQQWVCDEIDLERGKYVQRIGKYIFNGTEVGSDEWLPTIVLSMKKEGLTGDTSYNNGRIVLSNYGEIEFSNKTGRSFGFKTSKWGVSGYEELKTILKNKYDSGVPVLAQYILATPIETDLSPEVIEAYKKLHTNYPTTVVTNDSDAGMEVSYVADTKHYIASKIETPLQKQITDLQNALINQKISGGGIKVTDSAKVPVVDFAMWGKTEQVRTSGTNFFDVNKIEDTWNGSFGIKNNNGVLTIVAASNDATIGTKKTLKELCPQLKVGETYIFKAVNSGTRNAIYLYRSGIWEYGEPVAITDEMLNSELRFYISAKPNDSGTIQNIQVNRGDVVLPYEPYSGGFPSPSPDWKQPVEVTDKPISITIQGETEQQEVTLVPPRPLTKWDKLEKINGVWMWAYQSNTCMLSDIASQWEEYKTDGLNQYYFDYSDSFFESNKNNIYADKFISWIMEKRRNNYNTVYLGNDVVCFNVNENEFPTLQSWEEWVSTNPVNILYKTKTPEYIPLPQSAQDRLNALTMYDGATEITNNGGCQMDLTYTVDTKTYVDAKIADISRVVIAQKGF